MRESEGRGGTQKAVIMLQLLQLEQQYRATALNNPAIKPHTLYTVAVTEDIQKNTVL